MHTCTKHITPSTDTLVHMNFHLLAGVSIDTKGLGSPERIDWVGRLSFGTLQRNLVIV